ncbi:MAG: MBL-fold metallo-hydrolase superfamily [uncultured Acetobacteraceae bacterium]|jgi:glyoxylase-like metal-dependent hydrolase (beta-lactamase superfamily II)|uniref:MBL-fold metallo-hydrolase superfamily n=1 Tax=uncultured Acetobacteraceae bacterium TaxID=169975 RepID=A0A6J4H4P1_9PROT|nr:MAG: MBL-fold metallo-hydrolase superfamily [uncultured Acetobacteraceae bacterium]
MARVPDRQVPGVHHRRVGDAVVTAVSDGHLDGSMAVLQNIAPEEAARMLRDAFRPVPRRTAVNTFLIHAGGRVALVDTGCGDAMAATAGRLQSNLAASGVRPEEVDAVLLTHMHPDHSNGLADAKGRALFPRAELVMHEAEWSHWHDDAAMARADETARERNFHAARDQAAPYRDRLRLFKGGEVFPGVTAMPFPGHTPGHSGYMVASGSDSLLIWGDIVHVPEIQVPRPEVTMAFDVDPAQAEATRRRVFDMVWTDKQAFTGMHLHFPGHARLLRRDGGYALLPEAWSAAF